MKYEIKIDKAKEEKGQIDLKRIEIIAHSILHVAEGALQIRLGSISYSKGRKPANIQDALSVRLVGIKKGSTILEFECEPFSESLKGGQLDAFKNDSNENLPNQTPVSLFIHSFQDALDENSSKDNLDKPLLKELKNFKKAWLRPEEMIIFSNQGSLPDLNLEIKSFQKIAVLEDETPNPQSMIINGVVELMEYSKGRVRIITETGAVEAFLGNDLKQEQIQGFWGKDVTIAGTANYRPGGKLGFVMIDRIFKPGKGDEYFSKKKNIETVEQQIQRQWKEGGYKNHLSEIVGNWPGDETDEEFEEMLKMLTK